jgi:colanic acid/amylovoran biosynthesis glycosyltransferase
MIAELPAAVAPTAARRAVRHPVAVVVSRFPLITETFILREIIEMERQGQPVVLIPLIRERSAVVHFEAVPWIRRALYTPYLSAAIVLANLRTWLRHPVRYPVLLARLIAGTARWPGVMLRTLAFVPKAVYLARRLEADGIRHVHAQFATYPATVALIIHELTGITFSITAHAHDIFVNRALLGRKLERATFVRVISRFNAEFLRRLYPRQAASKLWVIHVGLDHSEFAPDDAAAPAERLAAGAPALILCIAALKPYKGIPVLIDACTRMRAAGMSFRCEVIGDGPQRAELERAIVRAGLEDVIRLAGARPQAEVRARLAAASVLVLPSVVANDGQMEGIPVALMEAMATGVPVVASRLSGIPELVVHDRTGELVPPGDAAAIADAVQRLLSDEERTRRLTTAAREMVRREFTLDANVAELIAAIEPDNPAPADEVSRIVSVLGPEGHPGAIGVRRVHERRDSRVVELLLPREGHSRATILKMHRSRDGESRPAAERGRHEYEVLEKLWADAVGAGSACGVPEPLELESISGSVLMEQCSGETLDSLIRKGRSSRDPRQIAALLGAITATGHWLQQFQSMTPRGDAPDEALSRVVARARQDLHTARRGGRISLADAIRIRKRLRHLARAVQPRAVTGHHGDFWPGNVFVSEHGVQVIDFEGFRTGLPEEDTAWFLVHLNLSFAYPGFATRRRRTVEAFLEGAEPHDVDSLELCMRATALALLARSVGAAQGPGGMMRGQALRAIAVTGRLVA